MTTITHPDVTHKMSVQGKYNPNSYRIFSENVPENESIPAWYANSRPPPFYTEPSTSQLPAQALEARNNPHAGRKVDMVYANTTNLNAPTGIIKTDSVQKEESRWWDWSTPKAEPLGPGVKSQDNWSKKRESSYHNAFATTTDSGSYGKRNSRYSANPHHIRTVGIVPITDLKPEDYETVNQTHVEKVTFEQEYDSRHAANYPPRGNRHGALVIEETKPSIKPTEGNQNTRSAKLERIPSVWDLLHPNDDIREQLPNNAMKYRRPLPQIKQTGKYDGIWQNAPFASDYTTNEGYQQPLMRKPSQ